MQTTTVLWPDDTENLCGFLYGWKEPLVLVAGVLGHDYADLDQAQTALELGIKTKDIRDTARFCGSLPCILGYRNPEGSLDLKFYNLSGQLNIIKYRRSSTRSMRFYSLDVLSLDVGENITTTPTPSHANLDLLQIAFDFTRPETNKDACINHIVINQMNYAALVMQHLEKRKPLRPQIPAAFAAITRRISFLVPIVTSPFLLICALPLPSSPSSTTTLKDVSSTFQQFDVRLELSAFFPRQAALLLNRDDRDLTTYAPRYILFYNSIWLVLNDIILGSTFGAYLCENHVRLGQSLAKYAGPLLVDLIREALFWLDNWPAGLKLNTELSCFASRSLLALVNLWSHFIIHTTPYFPVVVYIVGIAARGGITFALSLVSDAVAIFTTHIYVSYLIMATVFSRVLHTAGSLWHLFRGKRYNVLRARIDAWDYDLDQLLFGTILFTLLAFLFPTVVVYYVFFALTRLAVILVHASIETILAFMNHFPLFALMLRVKDPARLPGGIYFDYNLSSDNPQLAIKNQPIPFSNIFFQYVHLWSKLASHYSPLRLLRCFFTGAYLTPIPRYSIRYGLPKEPEGRWGS